MDINQDSALEVARRKVKELVQEYFRLTGARLSVIDITYKADRLPESKSWEIDKVTIAHIDEVPYH